MKKRFALAAVILIAVLPLMSCSSNKNTQSTQSTHTNVKKDSSKQSNASNGTSGNSSSTDSTSQNVGSKQNADTNQQVNSSVPSSSQQVLKNVAAALKTKVPLMLPTNVPVSSGKSLTATTKSETWYYKTQLYEANKPTKINSPSSSKGKPIAMVEGTEYKNDAQAKNTISGISQVDTSLNHAIDLGYGIKALPSGGAGHAYITWNEGRWTLWVNSPNDKTYQNPKYKNSTQVAKDVVAYLHVHALPAPQKVGVIKINLWSNATETTVNWQYHQMAYKVTSKDPLIALKVAVAMQFKSS